MNFSTINSLIFNELYIVDRKRYLKCEKFENYIFV